MHLSFTSCQRPAWPNPRRAHGPLVLHVRRPKDRRGQNPVYRKRSLFFPGRLDSAQFYAPALPLGKLVISVYLRYWVC